MQKRKRKRRTKIKMTEMFTRVDKKKDRTEDWRTEGKRRRKDGVEFEVREDGRGGKEWRG